MTGGSGCVLVVAERLGAKLDEGTWDPLHTARGIAGDAPVIAALLGEGVDDLASELAQGFDRVDVFDDARFRVPHGEVFSDALAPWIREQAPVATLLLHGNATIDLAAVLAVKAGVPLLSDCLSVERTEEGLAAVRALYGGKVHGRFVATAADAGVLATLRAGASGGRPPAEARAGEVRRLDLPAPPPSRRRTLETVAPAPGEVDISQADVLVGVGRGIEEEENLDLVRSLAKALGGELACSRPVVDKGWLPKSRQVGTSGVTVKPRAYVAVGISGSFQHLGGIKGTPFLVAINKDPRAPIFSAADVGIVGDLFEIVPLLEAKVNEAKAG